MFNRIDIIEKAGTGFGRMRKALAVEGFPEPEIASDSFFFITFRRVYNLDLVPLQVETGKKPFVQKSSEKSSEKILALLGENGAKSALEIAGKIGLSRRAVEKHLASFKRSGKIRRIGPDKGGHWEVIE
jgi:ATP-dependent DNA helicase RecG